jgi:hypothetical protein
MFIASFQTVLMSSLPFLCYVANLLRFALVGLEGLTPRNLRNGHLHTRRADRPGRPEPMRIMVMAETQISPESVYSPEPDVGRDPPGLRRLRFPSFKSHLSKSKSADGFSRPSQLAGLSRQRGSFPGGPVEPRC